MGAWGAGGDAFRTKLHIASAATLVYSVPLPRSHTHHKLGQCLTEEEGVRAAEVARGWAVTVAAEGRGWVVAARWPCQQGKTAGTAE